MAHFEMKFKLPMCIINYITDLAIFKEKNKANHLVLYGVWLEILENSGEYFLSFFTRL